MRASLSICILAACGGSPPAASPRAPIANAEPAPAAPVPAPAAAPASAPAPAPTPSRPAPFASLTGAGYNKDDVRNTITAHRSAIRFCYEKALLAHPGLAGRVDTRFTIGAGGAVSGVTTVGVDPDVDVCVVKVIASLTFPAPVRGAVRVAYPFVFAAK